MKVHLNQSVRPRITEPVAFVASPPVEARRRASLASNPDNGDATDLIRDIMEDLDRSFRGDPDVVSDDSDDEAPHDNIKVTLETKHSDNDISHAKTDKSNAPDAMQTENDTEVQPTSENTDSNRPEIPHTQQKLIEISPMS